MDGSKFYDGSNDVLSLLENSNHPFWTAPSSCSLQETLMMNFDGQEPQLGVPLNPKRNRIDRSLLLAETTNMEDLIGEEESDGNTFNQADKKRRLTKAQVKSLEKSFEEENKLEPERKMELAKKLGLQPKQVSIWFQNRRARYKSKQIEKEYDTLKANYDQLQEDYASLSKEKKNSDKEAEFWKNKYFEIEKNKTNRNIDALLQSDEGIVNVGTQGKVDEIKSRKVVTPNTKQAEDVSSAKSDIYDSESPNCMGGNQSSALPVEASSTLMRDMDQQSDFSQDDNEHMMINNNLLLPQTPPTFNNFLKVPEDVLYDPNANSGNLLYDPNANSCNFSLVDEQPVMWPWLY